MTKATATQIATQLDAVVKTLNTELDNTKITYLKTALKMWKGIVSRVAADIRELGGEAS